jgi:hypothetical protein
MQLTALAWGKKQSRREGRKTYQRERVERDGAVSEMGRSAARQGVKEVGETAYTSLLWVPSHSFPPPLWGQAPHRYRSTDYPIAAAVSTGVSE